MKPEKLTLEHIAGHLPYGLKYILPDTNKPIIDYVTFSEAWALLPQHGSKRKMILRRLDLTKPILVEGKEVIPIVELAKIAFPGESHEWKLRNNRGLAINYYHLIFGYKQGGFYTLKSMEIPNQKLLFQWLYKNHYDLDGLIDLNLAIDVDTLEVNPYE